AHHFKNTETYLRRILGDLADASRQLLLLTATPLQTSSENLLSLLRLIDHQAFERRDLFERRLTANTTLVQAERMLRAASPGSASRNVLDAHEILRRIDRDSIRLFGLDRNSQLTQLLGRLNETSGEEPSITEVAELAGIVADLNLLAPYITRTRKTDVQLSCVRNVETVRPELTPAERSFYDESVRWVRDRIRQTHGDRHVMFLSRNIERHLASSLRAL